MLSQKEIEKLVRANIITSDQGKKILDFQRDTPSDISETKHASFSFATTLYYLGGFLIIFAISYFLGTNWEEIGDVGRISSSLFLIIFFGSIAIYLKNRSYPTPSSLLFLAAMVAVPLFLYSVEKALGMWPPSSYPDELTYRNFLGRINTAWVILDSVSLAAAIALFYKIRYPILSLPIAHFVWFLMLDVFNLLVGSTMGQMITEKSMFNVIIGTGLVIWGVYYHKNHDNRVGVWPWIYGLMIILGSLITIRWQEDEKLLAQLAILVFGLLLLFFATPLRSKTFLTFGSIAVFWFIQDISWTYFQDSLGFTIVLIFSGLATIAFGIFVQRYYKTKFTA